jgi:hypothetical protein
MELKGNINTHIGIGYNATGVKATRASFGDPPTFVESADITSNIGMPFTSSAYPDTNTLGSYPYRPIELVADLPISPGYSAVNFPLYSYAVNEIGEDPLIWGILSPYSQIEIEGVLRRHSTTNSVDDDLSFFKLTFQTNFYSSTNVATEFTIINPTVETIGGYSSITNSSRLFYFSEEYANTYPIGTYLIQLFFAPKTYNRQLFYHITFL